MQIVIYEVLLIVYITYYVEKQQRMINNIFSDILNPTASAAMGGASAGIGGRPRHAFTFQHIHGDPRDYAWGSAGLDSIITQVSHSFAPTAHCPSHVYVELSNSFLFALLVTQVAQSVGIDWTSTCN